MIVSERFLEALGFAAALHRDQVRKGPDAVPYVSHLLLVAGTVLEYGGTEEQAIAGLLHDAVEDQGGSAMREEVYRRFGDEVGRIVDACTDTTEDPKPPWRARKVGFVESLESVPVSALLVILSDKLSNVRSTNRDLREFGPEIWNRFNGKCEGSLWYYRSIRDAVSREDPKVRVLAEEFDRAVAEMEELAGSC